MDRRITKSIGRCTARRAGGGGRKAAEHWVVDFLEEEEVRVKWLVGRGVPRERAQDLFWESIAVCVGRDPPPSEPRGYFFGVLDKRLKRFLRDEKPGIARMKPLPEYLPAKDPTPLEQVLGLERKEKVEAVLETLPEEVASVANLRLAGLSGGEVAEILGLAPRTARRHWRRARDALGAALR